MPADCYVPPVEGWITTTLADSADTSVLANQDGTPATWYDGCMNALENLFYYIYTLYDLVRKSIWSEGNCYHMLILNKLDEKFIYLYYI